MDLSEQYADWRQVFLAAGYEKDEGFRLVVLSLVRRGMLLIATLAVLGISLHLVAHVLIIGQPIALWYDHDTPGSVYVLWDKALVVALASGTALLTESRWGNTWGRPVTGALVLVACIAMTLDDVANGDPSFSAAFAALALFAAVAAIPYRPYQALLLGIGGILGMWMAIRVIPDLIGLEAFPLDAATLVYLAVLSVILTAVSGLLYQTRFRLYQAKRRAEALLADLSLAQRQLVHTEKMVSLGKVAGGIAHYIRNPLNFINNFSQLSGDLLGQLEETVRDLPVVDEEAPNVETRDVAPAGEAVPTPGSDAKGPRSAEIADIVTVLRRNYESIEAHGRQANSIVQRMIDQVQPVSAEPADVDLNRLVAEFVRISVHGAGTNRDDLEVDVVEHYSDDVGKVSMVAQEISRVLMNLLSNALDSVVTRADVTTDAYKPKVTIETGATPSYVELRIRDNGVGIPESMREKIFEPFFTTKQARQATGLGLSLSYEIVVEGHGGSLEVVSHSGQGAEFLMRLPRSA